MKVSNFTSFDGTKLNYYSWLTEKPVGTVVIFHGMAEHGGRYRSFADFLNTNGYDVYLMDFRGHGKNIGSLQGYFADKNGWEIIVHDVKSFVDHVFNKEGSKKVVLLGHSMGSLLLRSYLIEYYDSRISKVVLLGTPVAPPTVILRGARILSQIRIALGGRRKPAVLMDKLVFGHYSKSVKNPNTIFDWLSHDMDKVMKYIADPLCGFICTSSFFRDLFYGVKHCNLPSNCAKIDPTINVLILSGSEDPVGDFGKAPQDLCKVLSSVHENGNVTLKVYQEYRHEILNEVGSMRVYKDILEFIG